MAERFGKKITVIIEADGIRNFLGKGVVINIDRQTGMPVIEVSNGAGLEFANNKLIPNLGDGLKIKQEQICIDNCEIADDLAGFGLRNKECKLNVDPCQLIGSGLSLDCDNKICVESADSCVDDSKTTSFTVMADSKMTIEGHNLVLKKTYATYNVLKNAHGVVLDVKYVSSQEMTDTVAIPDGYGYLAMCGTPQRASTTTKPNFYKK